MRILCITPIKHLDGAFEKLCRYGEVDYISDLTKSQLKYFLNNNNVDWIFTNPNKQNCISRHPSQQAV